MLKLPKSSLQSFNVRACVNCVKPACCCRAACVHYGTQRSLLLVAGRETCDAVTEFDCTQMTSGNCISLTAVCDGRRDCHFAEDENATLCASQLEHSQLPV